MTSSGLRGALLALALLTPFAAATPVAAQSSSPCVAPPPVLTLAFGSRYIPEGESRSQIDEQANARVEAQLAPVDDFLRSLTDTANKALEPGADSAALAECVMGQIASWAEANALADLATRTSRLTFGSRLAGFGLVMLQVKPLAPESRHLAVINPWLEARMTDQMLFWEADAPDGASRGNLRAWAGLAGATIASVIDDPVIRGWAAWSASYVICTANPDGSLPQEMSRDRLALHYQLHAVAPLTVSAALLSQQGIDLTGRCDHALRRIVDFTVSDLETGLRTAAITGVTQSYFDGSDTIEGWQLAWLEAYLTIHFDPALIGLADQYRPLNYSKLGGDQTLIWNTIRF